MEFCPNCKFLLYTKFNKTEDGTEPTLINYCKNCNWKGEMKDSSSAIYTRNYQEDFIAEKVLYNKYSIYDVALPRVSFDCVNKKCATNINVDNSVSLVLNNLPADYSDEEFNNIFNDYKPSIIKDVYRIHLSSALIVCNTADQKKTISELFTKTQIDQKSISVEEYKAPKKEVLYIKYDNKNMKYLYMCAICGTSWKKVN